MGKPRFFAILLTLTVVVQGVAWADISGSKDHPLIPRFAGAEIIGYKFIDYNELTFALGTAYEASSSNYKLGKSQREEGRLTRILYLAPAVKSVLQVFRNY